MRIIKSQRVFLSAAARCRRLSWTAAENLFHFGTSGSELGAGFNLELSLSLEAPVDGKTGWMLSEANMMEWLWSVASHLDHKAIHEAVPEFRDQLPTLENMTRFLYQGLNNSLPAGIQRDQLQRLRLIAGGDQWVDLFPQSGEFFFTKAYRVQAVHRHHNPDLSWEENVALYNKCSALHGHEYHIEVSVKSPVDPSSGLVISRGEMDQVVEREILQPFNLSFLNEKMGNTSGEIITEQWSAKLRQVWLDKFGFVVVRETRKNSFVDAGVETSLALQLL